MKPEEKKVMGSPKTEYKKVEEQPVNKKGMIVKAVNFVSVRRYPVISAPVVGYVQKGEIVTILKNEDHHYKIANETRTVVGYISSEYCAEV